MICTLSRLIWQQVRTRFCAIIVKALNGIVERFLQVSDIGGPGLRLALAVHVAVSIETVAVIVASVILTEQSHDPIIALRVIH